MDNWSRWSGLNRRPTVYETVALPLSYTGESMETPAGALDAGVLVVAHSLPGKSQVSHTRFSRKRSPVQGLTHLGSPPCIHPKAGLEIAVGLAERLSGSRA
jgi:hypothetical protein